jgi:hypothetical protein
VRLVSAGGDALELAVVGYQFPDAEDPRRRYSWHVLDGRADTVSEYWEFRWQALTCDESPRLGGWVRRIAEAAAGSRPDPTDERRIEFTEPNLAMEVLDLGPGSVRLRVELDLEFRAPSNKTDVRAGRPNVLLLDLSDEQVGTAAEAWLVDVARYPDLYPYPT